MLSSFAAALAGRNNDPLLIPQGIHELLPCGASPDANKASAVLW